MTSFVVDANSNNNNNHFYCAQMLGKQAHRRTKTKRLINPESINITVVNRWIDHIAVGIGKVKTFDLLL